MNGLLAGVAAAVQGPERLVGQLPKHGNGVLTGPLDRQRLAVLGVDEQHRVDPLATASDVDHRGLTSAGQTAGVNVLCVKRAVVPRVAELLVERRGLLGHDADEHRRLDVAEALVDHAQLRHDRGVDRSVGRVGGQAGALGVELQGVVAGDLVDRVQRDQAAGVDVVVQLRGVVLDGSLRLLGGRDQIEGDRLAAVLRVRARLDGGALNGRDSLRERSGHQCGGSQTSGNALNQTRRHGLLPHSRCVECEVPKGKTSASLGAII